MADDIALTEMPVGSTFKIKAKIVSDDGTTMGLELIRVGDDPVGTLDITKASGVLAGQLDIAVADTQVEAVAINLAVNDIVQNQATGEVVVVQAVGLGPDANLFSTATSGQPSYAAEGWVVVGSATLT